ncbi:MAG: phage major capsid protein [Clostridia bacterium]|nr:phage major capsid protein [Clostridia bacterium]
MKFKTVAEAFNYYRNFTLEALENRAQEIRNSIDTDANVDVAALNIELTGIAEAKKNITDKTGENRAQAMNVITGQNTGKAKTFEAATVYDTPEYRNAFYKTMLGQKLNQDETNAWNVAREDMEKRADAFTASTDSGLATIPTSTLNEIVKKARTMGGLLAECRAFNVPTKIAVPVGTPSNKAAWHVEGATVDTDESVPTAVIFDGYEIIKIFSISAKVRTMSIPAFENYLVEELTACVMECINDALVNGTGSGQGSGLETITWVKTAGATQNAVEVAAASDIEYTDVVATAALLKRGYAKGAKWAMNNKTLYNVFMTMTDSNVRPIFIAEQVANNAAGTVGRILGFEVVIDDNIADNVVYLGNYKYLGYNMPGGIAIEVSRESGFRKGLIDYRALAIADCKPIVSEAFVKLYKAAANS